MELSLNKTNQHELETNQHRIVEIIEIRIAKLKQAEECVRIRSNTFSDGVSREPHIHNDRNK